MAVNHKIDARVIFVAVADMMGYTKFMINAAQIRAARALLGWKQVDLAKASSLSEMSIKNVERADTDPRVSTINAIRAALEAAGVTFLADGDVATGPGVALRPRE